MAEVVSSFELIYKPQSPADPIGADPVATVLQGYFLSISNLSDEDYDYSLRFVIVDPGDPTRSLTNNTLVAIDLPSANNVFTRLDSFDGENFFIESGPFTVPGNGTALVVVLPQVFGPVPGDNTPITTPSFEVRGYVEINLPIKFTSFTIDTPPGIFFWPVAQGSEPVPTLLTPQYRATYFDAGGAITDQTQSTVPTGSGAGIVPIMPDSPFFQLIQTDLRRLRPELLEGADERARATLLAALVSSLGPKDGIEAMRELLRASQAEGAE